jgi:uncharacterized protein (TIRG00374 family)
LKLALRLGLSLAVAVGLLAVLMILGGVGPAQLFSGFRKLSPKVYLYALLLHVALYVLRAVRFHLLLPAERRPRFGHLLSITASYTMASLILPAKLGEASFVVYAHRVAGVQPTEGTACLLVSRLLDLATLALGMSLASLALWATGTYPALKWLGPLGFVLLPVSLIGFAASARGDLVVGLLGGASRLLRIDRTKTGARLHVLGERLASALRAAGSRKRLLAAALVTLPAWICLFLFCAVLAEGLGLPPEITSSEAVLGTGLAIATSLLPLSAFANFGTLEAGWVLGFHALGVDKELAYATGIGVHLVQLANAILLGVLGHIGMAIGLDRDPP